jgi:hypothetical protein
MGVSGYLFVPWRDTTSLVMTPPAFRNPSVWRLLTGWDFIAGTKPDTALVKRRIAALSAAGADRLGRVRAVLVGHGHYDHLMDLPPMARWLGSARVYGSRSVINTLAGAPLLRESLGGTSRLVTIDTLAGIDATRPGQWVIAEENTFRFKAIAWEHARNFPGFRFSKGHIREPLNRLPRTAAGWRMGTTYAFILDVLDAGGATALRVVIHDAAASPSYVARADSILRTEPAAPHTVAIISAANYDRVDAYPDTMLALQPADHVLFGHWEEFFRSPEKPLRRVRGIRGLDLVQRVEAKVGSRWTALSPGAVLRVLY